MRQKSGVKRFLSISLEILPPNFIKTNKIVENLGFLVLLGPLA